jgi:hypothetical protein
MYFINKENMKTYRVYKPKKPVVGKKAYVYYDGKIGREIEAEITMVRGFAIRLKFHEYAHEEEVIEAWFIKLRSNKHTYGAFVKTKNGLMSRMFGLHGDWYSATLHSCYEECHGVTAKDMQPFYSKYDVNSRPTSFDIQNEVKRIRKMKGKNS